MDDNPGTNGGYHHEWLRCPYLNYGVMPAVGTNANLTAEEVAAIMNHERTSWGNNVKSSNARRNKKDNGFCEIESSQ